MYPRAKKMTLSAHRFVLSLHNIEILGAGDSRTHVASNRLGVIFFANTGVRFRVLWIVSRAEILRNLGYERIRDMCGFESAGRHLFAITGVRV